MDENTKVCSDCAPEPGLDMGAVDRRAFLRGLGVAVASASVPLFAVPRLVAAPTPKSVAETAAKGLFETLTDEQKKGKISITRRIARGAALPSRAGAWRLRLQWPKLLSLRGAVRLLA